MKRYLLTDFLIDKYKDIDINLIKDQISKLNSRCNEYGSISGEFQPGKYKNTRFAYTSHRITNIVLEDDRKVYGDVEFLNTLLGYEGNNLVNNLNYPFKVRIEWIDTYFRIYSWDIVDLKEHRKIRLNNLLNTL